MPIYEYRCAKCGHQLEALQKINDDPLVRCPACEQDSLQKLVSAASFRLKGGGWYETDFKKGNKKHLADSADSTSSGEKTQPAAGAKSDTADKGANKAAAGNKSAPATAKTDSAK